MTTEDRLWDYIDGTCSVNERTVIDQLLKTDATWKMEYDKLMLLHQGLQSMELDEPSMGFKNRVMEQVVASPHPSMLKTKVDRRIIYMIAAFFVAAIGGTLAYAISLVDWNASGSFKLPQVNIPAINWSFFGSSGYTLFFLAVNVVLGLVLLDKFLSARRKDRSMS